MNWNYGAAMAAKERSARRNSLRCLLCGATENLYGNRSNVELGSFTEFHSYHCLCSDCIDSVVNYHESPEKVVSCFLWAYAETETPVLLFKKLWTGEEVEVTLPSARVTYPTFEALVARFYDKSLSWEERENARVEGLAGLARHKPEINLL